MCFSATASFVSASLNASAGAAVMMRAAGTRDSALATFPAVFAVQQFIEGSLWLALPANPDLSALLATGFVGTALVVWPVLVPFSAFRIEEQRWRRVAMALLTLLGAAFAVYAAVDMIQRPYEAHIVNRCIAYTNNAYVPLSFGSSYVTFTCVPLLLSSSRTLRLLGACTVIGLVVSALMFFYNFLSVWCFFAALASGLVFFRVYFERTRAPSHGAVLSVPSGGAP
jgi:hypothetical protein